MLGTRHSSTESTPWAVSGGADPRQVPIDPNGNLSTKTEGSDTWAYEWNARNELTRVTKNSIEQARLSYDPNGRRVEKVAGGVTTSYTYDGDDIVREVRGAATLKYVYGRVLDEPLAMDGGTALSYFQADALGSIVKMTNASGAVTTTRQYDSWGSLETGASEAGYAFTGREWDPETGLYYYRARYYDPKMARFISEDPIGLEGGENFYAYVSNQPIKARDPLGLYRCIYYTSEHYLQCFPDDPWNPPYSTMTARAGKNTTSCNDCQDNPNRTNVSFAGPPAAGFYKIAGPRYSKGRWRRNLTPDQGGRSAIQLHGCGRLTASECSTGCIALLDADFDFLSELLKAEEGRNTMEVYGSGSFSGPPPPGGRTPASFR